MEIIMQDHKTTWLQDTVTNEKYTLIFRFSAKR